MKRIPAIVAAVAVIWALMASSCQKESVDNPDNDTRTALERYWADDYAGPLGIQIKERTVKGRNVPRMFLGEKLLYVTGMNCYNLFAQCHEANNMGTTHMSKAVKVLQEEQVPIVRFSASPFYPSQFHFYFDQKKKFLANLDTLASWCDRAHIALIPSFFWAAGSVPEYYGEKADAWGDTSSKTYAHMLSYTTDIVNTLKNHKSVVMWEFGNELNLQADIGNPVSASDVEIACRGFAELVKTLDNYGRAITTGNSIMRNAQYHLYTEGSWNNDSYAQYVQIAGMMTPKPMNVMSEHTYEDERAFSDKGSVNLNDEIAYAKQCAEENGCAYFVGEFTGPKTARGDSLMVRRHFIANYAHKVQVSLMWNYALNGDIEWSFRADTPYGNMAFNLMREYNERFKTVKE